MSENIYEIAALATRALRRIKPRTPRLRIVSAHCEICNKTHRMGLGEPRCTAPTPTASLALAAALVLGCLSFSGCAHYYVSGVTLGAQVTDTSKDGTIGIEISPNPYSYKAVVPLQK